MNENKGDLYKKIRDSIRNDEVAWIKYSFLQNEVFKVLDEAKQDLLPEYFDGTVIEWEEQIIDKLKKWFGEAEK